MKNFNSSNFELKELTSLEVREIDGGYEIKCGDVFSDRNGVMWRCEAILSNGKPVMVRLEGNVC
jgi:hypothetical protein